MKKLKVRIKNCLIIKIVNLRKEIKKLRKEIEEFEQKERAYIDKINLLKSEVRSLQLKLKEVSKL